MSVKEIESITVGTKTIAGADYPVRYVLERQQYGTTRPTWVVICGLCNGTPSRRSIVCRTKSEAFTHLLVQAQLSFELQGLSPEAARTKVAELRVGVL